VQLARQDLPPVANQDSWVASWSTNTAGQAAGTCVLQGDGNFVMYRPDGSAVWASNTWGHPGASLAVQDDENVVVVGSDGKALWSTDTWIGSEVKSAFDPKVHGFHFVNDFPDGYWQFGVLKFETRGLCGGMSFTALDYFFANKSEPATTSTPPVASDPVAKFINSRQQESVERKPASIGMGIYLNGSASHQIVACGYREGKNERWIITYDPNYPSRVSALHLRSGAKHWRTDTAVTGADTSSRAIRRSRRRKRRTLRNPGAASDHEPCD